MKAKSGGGITSNKNRNVRQNVAPRTTNVINPNQPDFLGQATAFPKGPWVERKAPDFAPMGNALTNNVGKGGPGTGRTIYGKSGSQGCYGTPDRGETGIVGAADKGARSILGEKGGKQP
jgi:hypothetical protein